MLRDENDYLPDPESFDILKMAFLIQQSAIPQRLCLILSWTPVGFFFPVLLSKNKFCSVCLSRCSHGPFYTEFTVCMIAASMMLSVFDILKPLDEYGTPIDPTVEYIFDLT